MICLHRGYMELCHIQKAVDFELYSDILSLYAHWAYISRSAWERRQ